MWDNILEGSSLILNTSELSYNIVQDRPKLMKDSVLKPARSVKPFRVSTEYETARQTARHGPYSELEKNYSLNLKQFCMF